MDRKHFLKLMALGGVLPIIVPSLSGCRKDGPLNSYNGTVTIIGAGAAGLYAGWLLKNAGATVRILEATDRIGGRVKELIGFSDFAIELGAEEIHGHRSQWYNLVKGTDAEFIKDNTTDRIFIDGGMKNIDDIEADADYVALQKLISNIGDYNGADLTMEAYLAQEGISVRMLPLANALLGNEFGTSNNHLGVKGVALEDNLWTAGDKNEMIKNRSFISILEEVFSEVIAEVQLNTHIFQIDYSASQVVCKDNNNIDYVSDKVIVTVPLGVLKNNVITFVPSLSTTKLDAISKLGMRDGMKVILKFSQAFWPENSGSIYGGNGIVPEFWATGVGGRSASDNILTAFVQGDSAASLSALGAGMVTAICAQLDVMYGAGVATGSLVDSHIENWFTNPYFQGTYSFPMVDSGNSRKSLADPVGINLFFAGEATHYEGHPATVHGALETGYRAAEEIVNSQ